MSMIGKPMSYSEDLKILALGESDDTKRHENIANAATDIFIQKCAIRSETKARLKLETKEVIQVSKERIRQVKVMRRNPFYMGVLSTMSIVGAVLVPVTIIPMAIIGVASNVIPGAVWAVTEKTINKREEEEKVLLLTLFPEAIRTQHIKEKAMPLIKEMFEDVDNRFIYKYEGGFFDSKETILERVIIDYKPRIKELQEYIDKKVYFQD